MMEHVSVAESHMRLPQANACPGVEAQPPHPSPHPNNTPANVKRMRRVDNGTLQLVKRAHPGG
jgi:hypothetical protein